MSRREALAAVGAGILLALASTPQVARADDGLEPLVAVGPGAQVVAVVGIVVALIGLVVERRRRAAAQKLAPRYDTDLDLTVLGHDPEANTTTVRWSLTMRKAPADRPTDWHRS